MNVVHEIYEISGVFCKMDIQLKMKAQQLAKKIWCIFDI